MASFAKNSWKHFVDWYPEAVKAKQEESWGTRNEWNVACYKQPWSFSKLLEDHHMDHHASLVFPNPNVKGDILLLHHCFLHQGNNREEPTNDPDKLMVIGVDGMSRFAPLRAFKVVKACDGQNLHGRRKFLDLSPPSVEDFFGLEPDDSFVGLRNEEGDGAAVDFESWPNHFWVPFPIFFAIFDSNCSVEHSAEATGWKTIQFLKLCDAGAHKEIGGSQEGPGELFRQGYPFLKFVWGAANGIFDQIQEASCPWEVDFFNTQVEALNGVLMEGLKGMKEDHEAKQRKEQEEESAIVRRGGPTRAYDSPSDDSVSEQGERRDNTKKGDKRSARAPNSPANDQSSKVGGNDSPPDWVDEMFGSVGREETDDDDDVASPGHKNRGTRKAVEDGESPDRRGSNRAHERDERGRGRSDDTDELELGRYDKRSRGRGPSQGNRGRPEQDRAPAGYERTDDRERGRDGEGTRGSGNGHHGRRDRGSKALGLPRDALTTFAEAVDLMAQTQAAYLKDQKESKSALGCLPDEQKMLFYLLNTQEMRRGQRVPGLSVFAKKIDRQSKHKTVIANLRYEVERLGGLVSEAGFASFLTEGFYSPMAYDKPAGFTVMMFQPLCGRRVEESAVARKMRLKELFGEKGLAESELDLYAKLSYNIPDSIPNLILQLKLARDVMALLTCEDGVGTEIYQLVIDQLEDEPGAAYAQFDQDVYFCARVLYYVDVIQHRFFKGMLEVASYADPYGRAVRRHVDTLVYDSFRRVFGSFHLGSMPRNTLPALFRQGMETAEDEDPAGARSERNGGGSNGNTGSGNSNGNNGSGSSQRRRENDPAWFSTNPDRVSETLAIPTGKHYRDLFMGDQFANARDWPKVNHHASRNKKARVCIRYLTTGKCGKSGDCTLAHVRYFEQLPADVKSTVRERLQRIYNA